MERKVLLFGLWQSLSFFAFAHSDLNGKLLDNCIDIDMANIEEYMRTLQPAETSATNIAFSSDKERENLLPFGALKTDWTRLHLLHDALPQDSVLKPKFKYLFRLLLIAYDQATRFAPSSESTKAQNTTVSESTVPFPTKEEERTETIGKQNPMEEDEALLNSTGQSQEVRTTLKKLSSPSLDSYDKTVFTLKSGISNFTTSLPKYAEDGVDAVATKNITQYSIEHEDGEKTTVRPDLPDTDVPIKLSTITAASIPTLGMSNPCSDGTDEHLYDSPINTTATLITPELQESSISSHTTPVSKEEIILNSTRENVVNSDSENYSMAVTISLSNNESVEKKMNSTIKESEVGIKTITLSDINVASSTETIMKEDFERSPIREEYSSAETVPNAVTTVGTYSTNSTPRDLDWTKKKADNTLSYRFSSAREEYSSAETVPNAMSTLESHSPTSTHSGRDVDWKKEETDNTLSYRQSTKIVPVKETSAGDESFLAPTISKSVSSQSQPLSSTTREDLAVSATMKIDASSSAQSAVTSRQEEQYSIREDYSSATTVSSYETTKSPTLTSTRMEEQLLLSTKNNTVLAELSTTSSVESLKKSKIPLCVKNTSDAVKKEESQSTPEVKPSSARVSSPIEESSTASSSTKFYTDANLRPITDSTENVSIGKIPDNEEMKLTSLDDRIEFVTSEKSTGKKQGFSSSAPRSNSGASSSPTVSTTTRSIIDEQSITVIVATELNMPRNEQHIKKAKTSKDEHATEKNTLDHGFENNTGIIAEDNKGNRKSTVKPNYVKNPLHAGSSRSNHIFRDFKHDSGNARTDENPESQQIILYESGGGAKTGSVWRPHIVRKPPVGNNIWRLDTSTENAKPYGYQRSSPSAVTKANVDGESDPSAKWPFQGRTNLLRSRKRGSANADVEKQFRWFYRQGEIEPSNKSRSNENHNTKIKIQCNNAQ